MFDVFCYKYDISTFYGSYFLGFVSEVAVTEIIIHFFPLSFRKIFQMLLEERV